MKNMIASVRARLLLLAKQEAVPFQRVLTLYMQESLLHRMVSTGYGDSIALKGGLLFYQLHGMVARPTRDIDLFGAAGDESVDRLWSLLSEAAAVIIDDGMQFDRESVEVTPFRNTAGHRGVRGFIAGRLGPAHTRLQIDMGFGDVVTGGPTSRPYRTLLGNRSFSINICTEETIAAEKLDAIISLGVINSRYKDLFDLHALLVSGGLPDKDVVDAAVNTFRARRTELPERPDGLSTERWESSSMERDWAHFLIRIGLRGPSFNELRAGLLPRLRDIYQTARTRMNHPEN